MHVILTVGLKILGFQYCDVFRFQPVCITLLGITYQAFLLLLLLIIFIYLAFFIIPRLKVNSLHNFTPS
jgi:hypothetical protein